MRICLALLLLSAIVCFGTSAFADPVKIQPVLVTASNSAPGSSPCDAVDGDTTTGWNSGGFATQWIQLDLGRLMPVHHIRLKTMQTPAGATSHTISVGRDPNNLTPVYTSNLWTVDDLWLNISGDFFGGSYQGGGNIRYIRITTTNSPSWVAWREIEVYGGLEYFGYYEDGAWGDSVITGATVNAGANLVTIPADSTMTTKLAAAKSHGAHAMIDISGQLFGNGSLLLDGWTATWAGIRNAIVNGGFSDTVVAFYLFDEPYSRGVTGKTMQAVANVIHNDLWLGGKATATILAGADHVSTCSDMAPYDCLQPFDWVGFDCYGPATACGYDGAGNLDSLNAELRSRLNLHQRMIAVPQANLPWYGIDSADWTGQEQLIEYTLNVYQKLIAADSKFICVLPWLWIDGNGSSAGPHSAESMPWIRERLYQIAYSFIGADTHAFPVAYYVSSTNHPYEAFGAFNRDPSDVWVSNGWAPQNIAGNLVDPSLGQGGTRVSRIQLTTWQDRFSSPTTHVLWGRDATSGTWNILSSWTGYTVDGQQLVWNGHEDLSAIRVDTDQSPSWVGWRDIQVFRDVPAAPQCSPGSH